MDFQTALTLYIGRALPLAREVGLICSLVLCLGGAYMLEIGDDAEELAAIVTLEDWERFAEAAHFAWLS